MNASGKKKKKIIPLWVKVFAAGNFFFLTAVIFIRHVWKFVIVMSQQPNIELGS